MAWRFTRPYTALHGKIVSSICELLQWTWQTYMQVSHQVLSGYQTFRLVLYLQLELIRCEGVQLWQESTCTSPTHCKVGYETLFQGAYSMHLYDRYLLNIPAQLSAMTAGKLVRFVTSPHLKIALYPGLLRSVRKNTDLGNTIRTGIDLQAVELAFLRNCLFTMPNLSLRWEQPTHSVLSMTC